MKKTRLNKLGKSSCSKLDKKCLALLTPIIKKLHPKCEACGQPTQVAHHWYEKSRCNRLRFDIDNNLIALCNSCHCKIHNRFGASISGCLDITDIIRHKRGEQWYENVKLLSRETIKKDIIWYQKNYEYLTNIINTTSL
jgi:phage terminase large subunit GpA-like protein